MDLKPAAKKPLLPKNRKDRGLPLDKGWSSFSEGSAGGSLVLLISGAIGTGVLALPYGVSCLGVLGSVSLFAMAGVATFYSNTILFDCVACTGHGSYGQLMSDILGKYGGMTLDLFVFVEGLGAVATYVVFIMDYVPQVCELWGPDVWCTDQLNVAAAATVVIWPLSCLKGLSALRYTSTCSIATILFTCLVVLLKTPSHFQSRDASFMQVLEHSCFNSSSFQVLSMACFAFMTHTNSPEIALRFTGGPSSARWVLAVQTLVLWAVYCGIAVCGYMSFLEDTKQDFLTNYDVQDKLIVMCRCLLSVTLVFACPLNMFPAVQALFNVLEAVRGKRPGQEPLYDMHHVRVPVSTLAFAITLGVALKSPHVADLITTISAYFSSPLMFAFPAIMYWKILRGTGMTLPVTLLSITAALWLAELSHFFI